MEFEVLSFHGVSKGDGDFYGQIVDELVRNREVLSRVFRGPEEAQEQLVSTIMEDIAERALDAQVSADFLESIFIGILGFFLFDCGLSTNVADLRMSICNEYRKTFQDRRRSTCTYRRDKGKNKDPWAIGHGADPDARQQWKLANRRK